MPKGLQGFQKGHGGFRTKKSYKKGGEKMSSSRRGEKNPNWRGGKKEKVCINCGLKFQAYKEDRIYCSFNCSQKSKKRIDKIAEKTRSKKGKDTPNWRGGTTKESELIRASDKFKVWRNSVYSRDNWTCQKCGEIGKKLHAHHIFNFAKYPNLRLSIKNGITLCRKCHREFHKRFGITINNKEQIKKFIKLKI
jgi:5-methylcytosine-specific restriction endonuclease McrA